jgi:predicted polyphosphate/ATP-dependent NAD kinase
MKQFKLGLVINPIAGIGGSVALKGSDGVGIAEQAIALGAAPKSNARASLALEILLPYRDSIVIYTATGDMGESLAQALGFKTEVVYELTNEITTAFDTEQAVTTLIKHDIDLLLFAGGDGTARNVCHIVEDKFPVLGIPAGCKIHSGVYAITPKAAGRVVELMITNQLVSLTDADVMDID